MLAGKPIEVNVNILKHCLGQEYSKLSPLIQRAHIGKVKLQGQAKIERGNSLANILCWLTGMPASADQAEFIVMGEHLEQGIIWNRLINGKAMNSWFALQDKSLVEKLGFIHMYLQLSVSPEGSLVYSLFKTRFWGIPIPRFLSPNVIAVEGQENDAYVFEVRVTMPVIGLLIQYAGTLSLETDTDLAKTH